MTTRVMEAGASAERREHIGGGRFRCRPAAVHAPTPMATLLDPSVIGVFVALLALMDDSPIIVASFAVIPLSTGFAKLFRPSGTSLHNPGTPSRPLRVLLTIDAECWPRGSASWESAGQKDVRRDIFGDTAAGEYGIRYQMKRFAEHGLRATYFVESLSAGVVGIGHLRDVVDAIHQQGQEVQLHAHAEWLPWMVDSPCPGPARQHLDEFSLEEQRQILVRAMAYMRECGVPEMTAFRAGNFTANLDTITVLEDLGIRYDSSLNAKYTRTWFGHDTSLVQPLAIGGVCELPVASYRDALGRIRPLHLPGCSVEELSDALFHAWQDRWPVLVMVLHSFDLLNRRRDTPDEMMLRRFSELCRLLDEHRDKFETVVFSNIAPGDVLADSHALAPLSASLPRTLRRLGEQMRQRWRDSSLM